MIESERQPYIQTQRRYPVPADATPDTIAEMVRAILSSRVIIVKIVIKAGVGEDDPGEMVVDMLVPNEEPPHGEPPEPDPENMWQLLASIELEDAADLLEPKLRLDSLSVIAQLLMRASANKRASMAWLVGDVMHFLRWMGIRSSIKPSQFLNMPLVEVQDNVPSDRLALLCGKSSKLSLMRADCGYAIYMDVEEKKEEPIVVEEGEGAPSEEGDAVQNGPDQGSGDRRGVRRGRRNKGRGRGKGKGKRP